MNTHARAYVVAAAAAAAAAVVVGIGSCARVAADCQILIKRVSVCARARESAIIRYSACIIYILHVERSRQRRGHSQASASKQQHTNDTVRGAMRALNVGNDFAHACGASARGPKYECDICNNLQHTHFSVTSVWCVCMCVCIVCATFRRRGRAAR